MTKISIITPTYNRSLLISRMIRSVLNQSYPHWELIVIDDGSTDNTGEVVKAFEDSRIKYYYTDNSGAADSRNVGVKHAQSEYIIFLDSDDEAKPSWLEALSSKVTSESNIVCCGYEKRDHLGNFLEKNLPTDLGPLFNNLVALFLSGTMLIKKELFLEAGAFDTDLPSMQHSEFFMRLTEVLEKRNIQIVNIFEALVIVHGHKGEKIRLDLNAIFIGNKLTLEKHAARFSKNKEMHFNYLSVAGVSAIKTNRIGEGKKFLIKALKVRPLHYKSYVRLVAGYTPFIRNIMWKK